MARLPIPFEAFAKDTTDDTTRSFRLEASQRELARSHTRLTPMGISSYGGVEEGRREPKSMGGSVPVARLAGAVGACLMLVALGAAASTSPTGKTLLAAEATAHPRLAALTVKAYAPAAEATPALGGADVVAFFSLEPGAPTVAGSADFSYEVTTGDDVGEAYAATFFFANAANLAAFAASPGAYLPRFGGFCAFGISSESSDEDGGNVGLDVADPTVGWPWAREHLGPPTDTDNWAILDGKLYFTFLPEVLGAFVDNYEGMSAAGEARWAEWFGADDAATGLPAGPFQVECMASGYGPPVTRTCGLSPQRSSVREYATPRTTIPEACVSAAFEACGNHQGDNPVNDNACSICLAENFHSLKGACPATDTAIAASVDKAFCW